MSRKFLDGFEAGDLGLWTGQSGAVVAAAQPGMDGNYCAYIEGNGDYLFKTVAAAAEYYCAFRYRPHATGTHIIRFYLSATPLASLTRDAATGLLKANRFSGPYTEVWLATSDTPVNVDSTALIEIYYKPHATTGIFQVKINSILTIDFTGNTGSAETFNMFNFYAPGGAYNLGYIDNFIVDDAGWIGNTRIQAIAPTGAGNSTQWTPSAGDNYACVDEIPPSASDYIYTNTVDKLDTYAAGNLTGIIGEIKSLQVQAEAVRDGAATPENLELALRTNGTDYFSGDKEIPTSAAPLSHIWELNPDTGVAWTEADVNGLEIGVKSKA